MILNLINSIFKIFSIEFIKHLKLWVHNIIQLIVSHCLHIHQYFDVENIDFNCTVLPNFFTADAI